MLDDQIIMIFVFSNRKKKIKKIKRRIEEGVGNVDEQDPFEMFITSTSIRYCFYNETHKILGNTFGMCVLQVG